MKRDVEALLLLDKHCERQSTAVSFLNPAKSRPNLTLITRGQVKAINIDGGRATGVTYQRSRSSKSVGARREVLLCAGAVQSPHLLMLSGIGAGETLAKFGNPAKLHKPAVGQNLQDQLDVMVRQHCTQAQPSSVRRVSKSVAVDFVKRVARQ